MGHVDFRQLIEALCALTGFASAQHILRGDGIEFEGVTFALTQQPKAGPDALFIYADFGPLGLEQQARLYPLMLKENFLMMRSRQSTFSVSAATDSVVLIEKMALPGLTAEKLLAQLRLIAHRVNYFNRHHRDVGGHLNRPALRNHASVRRTLNLQDHAPC
ncbi:hypothetical protein RCH09_003038 [Actimicrobium sp. GrIS 1.19]|uniref:CesT family type III secretion system chaperone n=1 Tax=Actimicrobium sp. GrIS 1.19 TaxID=3071708 RepID=UPI002DF789B1|nr:hypothetical protein [Actimicrobium sp. GrIS 1.19]